MEQLKFNELKISSNVLKALEALGYESATPIQSQAIPHILDGRDVIGLAQTGTGKTCAFGVPLLEKIDKDLDRPQVIVLSPTRELALQITSELRKYSQFEEGLRILSIYGGESIDKQIMALKKRPQIIVGTPGRIMDHMRRKTLRLDDVRMVVLDEADEMLNMGFQEDIDTILKDVPETKQMVLFSATFPKTLMEIAKTYQKDPITINVRKQDVSNKNVKQYLIETTSSMKNEVVSRILDGNTFRCTVIFCNTKRMVDELCEYLHIHGYRVKALHGDMKQKERDFVMNLFRKSQLDVLVATDVAARGIDVDEIDAVINYDIPQEDEYYIHRIGRTGRAGREGVSYVLANKREGRKIVAIERLTKVPLIVTPIPSVSEINDKRIQILINEIKGQAEINEIARNNYAQLLKRCNFEFYEVGEVLFSMLFETRFPQLHDSLATEMVGTIEKGYRRFYINLGNEHHISPGAIIKLMAINLDVGGKNFGTIDISGFFSYFEVLEEVADKFVNISKKISYNGVDITISQEIDASWKSTNSRRSSRGEGRRDSRSEGGRRDSHGGDRSRRSSGERGSRSSGERSSRPSGERSSRPSGERSSRPSSDRPRFNDQDHNSDTKKQGFFSADEKKSSGDSSVRKPARRSSVDGDDKKRSKRSEAKK